MTEADAPVLPGPMPSPPFQVWKIVLHDLRFGVAVWGLLAAAILWVSWKGELFGAFVLGILGFAYGMPTVLLVVAASLVSAKPAARIIRRIALQGFIVGVLAIPLPFLGGWAQTLSIRESQRRGDRIAELLEAHRRTHGALPATLAELEKHTKEPLPRPTMRSEFGYSISEERNDYQLTFYGAGGIFPTLWFRSSGSTRWGQDD